MLMKLKIIFVAVLLLFLVTFMFPEEKVCYWEIEERERHHLNWIFEPPEYSHDPEKAAIEMAKYASLMGYDFVGTKEYNEECGIGNQGYWASNTMYGVIDWVPEDPRTVCLRANINEDFPCFISWRMREERDPGSLTEEDKLRYLNGEFLSYWIDVQRDDVIDMYLNALEKQPGEGLQWDEVDIIYFDEFTSMGYSHINEDYELEGDSTEIEFRCHDFHQEGGVDGLGHNYKTPEEGRLVMEARMIELAHKHNVKIAASGGRDWFEIYLPYINGEKPESEWPYNIPLERFRAAEPDYFVIEPDLGDPGTQEFEWSLPDYSAAEPYAQRVYAGSPRPGDPEIGVDSEKNIFTVEQVIFRAGYLASKGFWFGPNSETIDAVLKDPDNNYEKNAIKSFLKAIPNWENLNDVSLSERNFDMETRVYQSHLTYLDQNLIYSKHPFTGDFHVVFIDDNAVYPLEDDWEDYYVYRTSPIWERLVEAKSELSFEDDKITLNDKSKARHGYVITKKSYDSELRAKEWRKFGEGFSKLRIFFILGMVIVLIAYFMRRKR